MFLMAQGVALDEKAAPGNAGAHLGLSAAVHGKPLIRLAIGSRASTDGEMSASHGQ